MTNNVEPAEAAAIREIVEDGDTRVAAPEVERRDFAEPRRLSAESLRRLGREVAAVLPTVSSELAGTLRRTHKLTLASVAEISVKRLFDGLASPFLVWCFDCNGQLGWLVWDSAAANRLVETVLCGRYDEKAEARRFSLLECQVLTRFFSTMIGAIVRLFELEPRSLRIAQAEDELDGIDGVGKSSDTQRLMIHLSFDGPGGTSELRAYLPGVFMGEELTSGAACPRTVPDHIQAVPVELHAYLGSVDVPLQELLGLEVGDVLPLDLEAGTPLQLFVEESPCARAELGKHKGMLAVKIMELDLHQSEIDQPQT